MQTRPHRISRAWSTALLEEWTVQASIETEFGLPVSVMTLDPTDTKAQAKSQVGFIDLFAKPLFNAMAGVVDGASQSLSPLVRSSCSADVSSRTEFADFAEKLRDGRIAWEAISLQSDEAFRQPIVESWKLAGPPPPRPASVASSVNNDITSNDDDESEELAPDTPTISNDQQTPPALSASLVTVKPVAVPGTSPSGRRPAPLRQSYRGHRRHPSGESSSSANASPLSPSFPGSVSSAATNTSSFTAATTDSFSLFSSPRYDRSTDPFSSSAKSSCGGACTTATAMCEPCCRRENSRRGSLGRALAGIERGMEEQLVDDDEAELEEEDPSVWPPFPFM